MIFWLLAGALGLLLLLLILPVRIEARASSAPHALIRLRLLGGLVSLRLMDSDRPAAPKAGEPAKRARAPRRQPPAKLLKALPRALVDLFGALRIEVLRGEARVGLGDPALTGEFYGRAMGPLAALRLRDRVRLVPLFDRQTIEGEGDAVVSLRPIRLVPIGVRLLWALR